MDEAKNVIDGISDKLVGATVNDYAVALSWLCLGMGNKTVLLKNTDGANALKYKVLTYANKDGVEYEEIAETVLAAGDTTQVVLEYGYALVELKVKSSVGGSHATYELDYVGNSN